MKQYDCQEIIKLLANILGLQKKFESAKCQQFDLKFSKYSTNIQQIFRKKTHYFWCYLEDFFAHQGEIPI